MISFDVFKVGHWPLFIISFLSALSNLLLPIVLVRLVSPEEIGLYKIFFLYSQSLIFISLAGGPLYSVYYWVGKKEKSGVYIEQAWILSLLLSILCGAIGLIFLKQISSFITLTENHTLLLLLSLITTVPSSFYSECLIAKGQRISGSLLGAGFEVLKVMVIIGSVYYFRTMNSVFIGFSILFLIKLAITIYLSFRTKIATLVLNLERMKEVIIYCLPISTASVLSFIVEKIDVLILTTRLDPVHFAYYTMGCLVIPPLALLEMSIQKVLIPELSSSFHDKKFEEMIVSYRQAQSDIAHIMIPAVFGLVIFSGPIIEMLFTSKYSESAIFLKIYALTYLTYIIPHDSIPRATGNTKWILQMYLILTPISVLTVYYCAGKYGAVGALASSVVFMFFPKIPGLIYSAKITKTTVRKLISWKAFLFYFLINIGLSSICLMMKPLFINEKSWMLTLIPAYAALYLVSSFFIKKMRHIINL